MLIKEGLDPSARCRDGRSTLMYHIEDLDDDSEESDEEMEEQEQEMCPPHTL